MLRLIQSLLVCLVCVPTTEGRAQPRETWVFDREGVEFDLEGGCTDHDAFGLWLFVRARYGNKLPDTVELWFVDISASQPSARLQVVAKETVREAISISCVVASETKLAWRLVDRGKLQLHRLSRAGLEPITAEFGSRWEYPAKAVVLGHGALAFVANDAIGIVDVEAGTVARHERWTAAAWINPDSGDLYSVREVEGTEDTHGLPPVALVREVVLPDGSLRMLASTESWPAMQPVEEGSPDEIGPIEYQLVATPDEVLLLRSHYLGKGHLQISAWEKETLRFGRTFSVDIHDSPGRSGVFEAAWIGDELVLAVPDYPAKRSLVRLLFVDTMGTVRESAAAPSDVGALLDIGLFGVGTSIYAVSTQWMPQRSSRPVTVDIFAIR